MSSASQDNRVRQKIADCFLDLAIKQIWFADQECPRCGNVVHFWFFTTYNFSDRSQRKGWLSGGFICLNCRWSNAGEFCTDCEE